MFSKRLLLMFLFAATLIGGCIFDSDDDKKRDELTSIEQLTMGGGVFIFHEEEFGVAQIATFYGLEPYEDATVFVNGIQLANNGGIHTNADVLNLEVLTSRPFIRIAVYALGDSLAEEIALPESPVIVKPEAGAVVTAGNNLDVEIGFPGNHQYIAMTIVDQEKVAFGAETSSTLLSVTIDGEKLPHVGTFPLNAYAVNTSGDIPEEFDIENQYKIFLVTAVTIRNITFTSPD